MTTTSSSSSTTSSSLISSLGFITPTQLHQMTQDKPCSVQIVDSRSFLNYNTERITGSVNIYCPPLVKRRFQTCLPLTTMLTRETKATLCRPSIDTVVIHDQFTDETLFNLGQSDLQLVLHSLAKFLGHRRYLVLAGGYFRFRQEWPSMCSSHTSLSGQLCHVTRNGSPKQSLSPKSPSTINALHLSTTKTHSLFSLTPVELLPYLYIGDTGHSSRKELLKGLHITAILNVSTSCENHFPFDFRYKVIPVEDSSNANLLEWFQDATLFIEQEKESGGKVLVHCYGGISRSATVCLAYLMYTRHLNLDEAFEYVKSRRQVISPNANFMMQLTQFEQELRDLGFIKPAASLQKPLSPRRLSSVVSCPDMGHFMDRCVEMDEGDEEEYDENEDVDINDQNKDSQSDSDCLRLSDDIEDEDSDNNNDEKLNESDIDTIGSDKNDNNICVDYSNESVLLQNESNEEDACNVRDRTSPFSNMPHSSSFLSTTLASPS